MLFAKKITILILCLCATIQYHQAETSSSIVSCNFDDGDDTCGFNGFEGIDLQIEKGISWNSSTGQRPTRPLSDVTSSGTQKCVLENEIIRIDFYRITDRE